MSARIIIIGAGPIGLWTAVQLKLRQPSLDIFIKEQRPIYSRNYTLWLRAESFTDCAMDDFHMLEDLLKTLRQNPHIRIDRLQNTLTELALKLGIIIQTDAKVGNIERDICFEHPDAALIIGADSIHSTLNQIVFGGDHNTQHLPLGYAAQIKYRTQGDCFHESSVFDTYPLLKQSHFLSYITHGKTENNQTPITIQILLDRSTYQKMKSQYPDNRPVRLFAESIHNPIPDRLLEDIKTQLGYRLSQNENILLNSVQLTISELPQQRRHRTVLYQGNRFYGLIGDAALGLSYFKGMNSGLQLASRFAQEITQQWQEIDARNPHALDTYAEYYNQFANTALQQGYQTNSKFQFFRRLLTINAHLPVQSVYVEPNDMADYHRRFEIMQQASQFYLEMHQDPSASVTARELGAWLTEQMPIGLEILQKELLKTTQRHQQPALLHSALLVLGTLKISTLSFYEQAYLGLTISKTQSLLHNLCPEEHEKYCQFLAQLKPRKSSFYHHCTLAALFIAGSTGFTLGLAGLLGWVGINFGLSIVSGIGGVLLLRLGLYFHWSKPQQQPNQTCIAVESIAAHTRSLAYC